MAAEQLRGSRKITKGRIDMSKLITMPGDEGYIEPGSKEYADHLGCSEIAAVLGFDQWGKTANDVWMKKTHRAPDTEHKRIFDRGHAMEPLMASMLATDHGRVVKCEQVQYRHPNFPWLIYHADGMFSKWTPMNEGATVHAGPGIWEAKAPGSHVTQKFHKEGMSEGYVVQTQMGMMVASAALDMPITWATAGFLDYDNYELVPFDMAASRKFQDDAIIRIEKFWKCVQSDTPPSPINPLQHVRPPVIDGELKIIEDEKIISLSTDLAALIGPTKDAETAIKIIKGELKELLDGYSIAEIPGLMKFSYRYGKKDKETINAKGLLAYCEHLVEVYNEVVEIAPELDNITFDRSQWVATSAPGRTFRPTVIDGV